MNSENKRTDILGFNERLNSIERQVEQLNKHTFQSDVFEKEAWEEHDLSSGSGKREIEKYIKFSKPFLEKPTIHLGLTYLDTDSADHHLRISVEALEEEITLEGFLLRIRTFDDTRIHGFRVNWLAFLA